MGHHARTLTAVFAVLVTTLVVASTAAARPVVVRVETRAMGTIASGAFVPRVAVDPTDAVTVNGQTCAATSPLAALNAAVGAGNWGVPGGTNGTAVMTIKGLSPGASPWNWVLYVDQHFVRADQACSYEVPPGSEVLFYQGCTNTSGSGCYSEGPLYMRIRDGGPYDIAAQTVPGRGAPVVVHLVSLTQNGGIGPATGATSASVRTDENVVGKSDDPTKIGEAGISFTGYGPHTIMAFNGPGTRPPVRMNVCVSEGNDGYCGSTKVSPPPEIPYDPSPCATNGHDGFCGTTDTSGPIAHVTNIRQKQTFKKRKGPGQIKGTIDTDPNGVKDVRLRLTRVTTTRVAIKTKKKGTARKSALVATTAKKKAKKRYRTVKRCSVWDDGTALLETAKCGVKPKWFQGELSDLRNEFTYSFALTLPAGAYTLEVLATDENGYPDAVTPGRNVVTFTVQ
jgi:hypothetical protein